MLVRTFKDAISYMKWVNTMDAQIIFIDLTAFDGVLILTYQLK